MSDYNDYTENELNNNSSEPAENVSTENTQEEGNDFSSSNEVYSSSNEGFSGSDSSAQPTQSYSDTGSYGYAQPGATYHQAYQRSQQNQSQTQQSYGSAQYSQYTAPGASSYTPYSTYQQTAPVQHAAPVPPAKQKKSGAGKKVLAVILAVLVIGASIGIGTVIGRTDTSSKIPPSTTAATETAPTQTVTSESVAVPVESTMQAVTVLNPTDVAERVRKSVVGVMTYSTANGKLAGEGSGVVLCETGNYTYVITCAHVISDKGLDFEIMLLDGTTYDAKLVGYDERTDIGVLSVEAKGLPVATFGDSSALKIGETVYAIGNPGGSEYFGSMTSGIVSAIDRSISSTYSMTVIQHDAAINPGNSGGALVNSSGQVVGINSSKISATDYEGMGFAVPTTIAKNVAESIIAHGYVPNRPKLGIQYSEVSNYQFYSMLVRFSNLPQGSLIISSISPDSGLAGTDVKEGDLIIAVNGKNLDKPDVLLDLIEKSKVGDKLRLKICRVDQRSYDTKTFEVEAVLVEDKGGSTADTTETTTDPYSYYFGNGGNYEDFFRQFFGN